MAVRESTRRRNVALAALAALVSVVLVPAGAALARPRPPNPSDRQINTAQAAKAAAASQVGAIAARIALTEAKLDQLKSAAQLAEQKLALALQRQEQAKVAAAAAKGQALAAQTRVAQARTQFSTFIRESYMSAPVPGTTGALLTAADPNAMLDRLGVQHYIGQHQLDAIGQLNRATVVKSNADAAARKAVDQQTQAAVAAQAAQQGVLTALARIKTEKAGLDSQLVADRQLLQAAQIKLTGLTDQRAAYQAWQAQQAAIAAANAARLRAQQQAQARAAAANAAKAAQSANTSGTHGGNGPGGAGSGGGSGSGGGGGAASGPVSPGGDWTAAKGQQAVDRVMGFLDMPYAFAAGNASGPTYGVCVPGDAWNDCHIYGLDCSGLTLYAWAPWLSMDHFAATQYTQAGSYHPSTDNLMPGDLVFWSGDGTVGGIGHVAMYIGAGNVIQAPQSGDVIKITNVFNVESGYYGATRPLT